MSPPDRATRRLPRLDGYMWWVVSDIPGGIETDVTSYGVLDMLYQPEKFPDFDWFRRFNRESVLVIDAEVDQRMLRADEPRPVKVSLSHFGAQPVRSGRLRWEVTSAGRALARGLLRNLQAAPGRLSDLGVVTLGPFPTTEPLPLTFAVTLDSDACRQSNAWEFWAFPAAKPRRSAGSIADLTGEPDVSARYHLTGQPGLAGADLILARELTPAVREYVRAGGRAILLEDDPERSAVPRPSVVFGGDQLPRRSAFLRAPGVVTYWPLWLRCNAQVVEDHPALSGFPHEGFAGFQLMRLFGSSTPSVDLTSLEGVARRKVRPIIWALSLAPVANQPPFNLALTWHALLSECRAGRGRVLLCNLYVLDGLRRGYPEAGCLLDGLVDYALSDHFEPSAPALTDEEAQELFR